MWYYKVLNLKYRYPVYMLCNFLNCDCPALQVLLEATVKAIPQKVLGSAAYQVANMDVLNVSLVVV